jgi:hypothetical protein
MVRFCLAGTLACSIGVVGCAPQQPATEMPPVLSCASHTHQRARAAEGPYGWTETWCERPDGTRHGPTVFGQRHTNARIGGAYDDGGRHGLWWGFVGGQRWEAHYDHGALETCRDASTEGSYVGGRRHGFFREALPRHVVRGVESVDPRAPSGHSSEPDRYEEQHGAPHEAALRHTGVCHTLVAWPWTASA